MTAVAKPEHGDITISPTPAATYGLAVIPGALQVTCRTYEEALAMAKRFASERQVDVWVAIHGREAVPVSRHRVTALTVDTE